MLDAVFFESGWFWLAVLIGGGVLSYVRGRLHTWGRKNLQAVSLAKHLKEIQMDNSKSGLAKALVEFWDTQKEDATPERLVRAASLFLATQGVFLP